SRTRSTSSAPRSTTSARGERCCCKGCGWSCWARSSELSPGWERVDCWREHATRSSFTAEQLVARHLGERRVTTFPLTRMRRFRRSDRLRALVRETRLDLEDFVLPLFVGPRTEPNPDLPPFGRFTVDDLVEEAQDAARLGVRSVILFGIP